MSAFQTLREHGHLPLVQVDADGHMRCAAGAIFPWESHRLCVQQLGWNGTLPELLPGVQNLVWVRPARMLLLLLQ
jgi:hypothetical protein